MKNINGKIRGALIAAVLTLATVGVLASSTTRAYGAENEWRWRLTKSEFVDENTELGVNHLAKNNIVYLHGIAPSYYGFGRWFSDGSGSGDGMTSIKVGHYWHSNNYHNTKSGPSYTVRWTVSWTTPPNVIAGGSRVNTRFAMKYDTPRSPIIEVVGLGGQSVGGFRVTGLTPRITVNKQEIPFEVPVEKITPPRDARKKDNASVRTGVPFDVNLSYTIPSGKEGDTAEIVVHALELYNRASAGWIRVTYPTYWKYTYKWEQGAPAPGGVLDIESAGGTVNVAPNLDPVPVIKP
ncbi:hypothetical protein FACS1894204_01040 [Synergistales bacterium]|nr:hypothetical protein FACS1894204_01040 [Synergistales bacterium]